jgi:hypothetical protein
VTTDTSGPLSAMSTPQAQAKFRDLAETTKRSGLFPGRFSLVPSSSTESGAPYREIPGVLISMDHGLK